MSEATAQKRRWDLLRAVGRCTQCGNRDARTETGRAMCAVCAVKQQEWYAQRKRRRME